MEKLPLIKQEEIIKVSGNLAGDLETQKQKDSIYRKKEVFAGILILLIILPESLIYSGKIGGALLLYAGILTALSLISIFVKDQGIRNICQVFLLLPILRLINFSMPTFSEIPLLSFVFIYSPMVIPVVIVAIQQKFTYEQLGLNFRNMWIYLPASIIIGIILGQVEYSIIQPVELISDSSFINILKLIFVMVIVVGLIEEIIFRSILQTKLEEFFGIWSGLIFSSLLFGLMNSGFGSLYEIFYAIFIGLFIGYMFQKTRSLPFVALTHGFINVFSFGIIHYLWHGLGLL